MNSLIRRFNTVGGADIVAAHQHQWSGYVQPIQLQLRELSEGRAAVVASVLSTAAVEGTNFHIGGLVAASHAAADLALSAAGPDGMQTRFVSMQMLNSRDSRHVTEIEAICPVDLRAAGDQVSVEVKGKLGSGEPDFEARFVFALSLPSPER